MGQAQKPPGVALLERIQAHPQPDQDPGLTISFSLSRPIPSGMPVVTVVVDKAYLGAQYIMLTLPELATLTKAVVNYFESLGGRGLGNVPSAGVQL